MTTLSATTPRLSLPNYAQAFQDNKIEGGGQNTSAPLQDRFGISVPANCIANGIPENPTANAPLPCDVTMPMPFLLFNVRVPAGTSECKSFPSPPPFFCFLTLVLNCPLHTPPLNASKRIPCLLVLPSLAPFSTHPFPLLSPFCSHDLPRFGNGVWKQSANQPRPLQPAALQRRDHRDRHEPEHLLLRALPEHWWTHSRLWWL